MTRRPKIVFFDVMGTLFDLAPIEDHLVAAGLPPALWNPWFTRTLRDGFALAAAGTFAPFKEVASAALAGLATDMGHKIDPQKLATVVGGLAEMPAHPDVRESFDLLRAANIPIVLFSNSGIESMRKLITGAGLADYPQALVSIDEPRAWKPRPESYRFALERVETDAADAAMVASHTWDCHGAKQVGMTAAWVRRRESYPNPVMAAPDVSGDNLIAVVRQLLEA